MGRDRVSVTQQGWFADVDEQQKHTTWPWQPCLQLDGMCFSFDIWFTSETECVAFIKDHIIGQDMFDTANPVRGVHLPTHRAHC